MSEGMNESQLEEIRQTDGLQLLSADGKVEAGITWPSSGDQNFIAEVNGKKRVMVSMSEAEFLGILGAMGYAVTKK